jgi:hypothetical protein
VCDELEACEEGGVVERRCDLTDASADGVDESATGNHRRGYEASCTRSRPECLVHREPRAGSDDGAVEEFRGATDVDHAGLAGGERRRERADDIWRDDGACGRLGVRGERH